ncbi:sulfite exporter TauE/SafE family protein [Salinisphaera sp. C84B14]|uniref:sulfite exporter TauE/SafE family protein n=1 Tax=Salinisphaera sp. C84B14 TaxID=1304155 RepID=UPI0033424517
MVLLLGIAAGLAYGLTAFAGAFLAVPLLVLFADVDYHRALPIALFALGICAAIAAGDAVRARQCDVQLSAWLMAGSLPTMLILGALAQRLSEPVLGTIFLIASLVFGPLLLLTLRAYANRMAPPPAALLDAPRRSFTDATTVVHRSTADKVGVLFAGVGCGALAALAAAPGALLGWRILERRLAGQPHLSVGTLALASAVLATLAAGWQFLFVADVPGYTAGLYVLGTTAGMGIARRAHKWLPQAPTHRALGCLVVIAALALWVVVVRGATAST